MRKFDMMPNAAVYEPSKSLPKRIARRLTPLRGRHMLRFNLERPIVSFSFDDCPKSVVGNGLAKLNVQGWKSTIYIASGLLGTTNHHGEQMSREDVIAAHKSGHEIGGHSYSHIDLSEIPFSEAMRDIETNRAAFEDMGLPPSRTFAYPFGQTLSHLKTQLANDYDGLRGITSGAMIGKVDLNQIHSTPLFSGTEFETLVKQIETLPHNAWLTLFTHDIQDSPTEWGCTPAEMDAVISAVKARDAEVLTIADAIQKLKAKS
jgi:peptidoglycan/xylan/chitin deacetylase (PgdA/CDA1 family)